MKELAAYSILLASARATPKIHSPMSDIDVFFSLCLLFLCVCVHCCFVPRFFLTCSLLYRSLFHPSQFARRRVCWRSEYAMCVTSMSARLSMCMWYVSGGASDGGISHILFPSFSLSFSLYAIFINVHTFVYGVDIWVKFSKRIAFVIQVSGSHNLAVEFVDCFHLISPSSKTIHRIISGDKNEWDENK